MILVNCGASQDLQQLLDLKETDRLIVLDSHRCQQACCACPPTCSSVAP